MLFSVAPAGVEQMFFECGVAVAHGTTTAPPPAKAEIEKLLEIAPRVRDRDHFAKALNEVAATNAARDSGGSK